MKVSQVCCFQTTGRWICYSIFFRYLIYSVFHEAFVKKFMEKLSFFNSSSKNPFQDVVYYRKLGCLTLWYWISLWPFEYKVKSWEICPFWDADILNFSWIKYFSNDSSFLKKWHIWVYYCWNYWASNLKADLKADFWSQIHTYSRKNYLRHSSGKLPPANSYWSGDVGLMFLMSFLKSIDTFS